MIIDTSNTLPTREMLFADILTPAPGMEGYLKLFGTKWAGLLGMTMEEFQDLANRMSDEDFKEELMKKVEAGPLSMDNFIRQLKDAGITYSAVHNMDEENAVGSALPNDYVADILKKYPNQFIAFSGFNPHKGKKSLDEVERALTKLGFGAVVFRPYMHGFFADDRKYYPLYALCQDKNVPIWIHTSVNWVTGCSIYYGHPSHLEPVLLDFPKLNIIAGHGGWPWVPDLVLMMWKYANLYADTSAHRPKYIATPSTGWDIFIKFANSTIQDKIVFGSDWLSIGMSIKDVLNEIDQWPLKDSVKEKFFYHNAARIFNLKGR